MNVLPIDEFPKPPSNPSEQKEDRNTDGFDGNKADPRK